MGTRNLTCVWIDGGFKVAQYGQWDGYPSAAGAEILSILKSINLEQMKVNVRKITWVTKEEVAKAWIEVGANPDQNFVNMAISDRFKARHPEWDRDMGRQVLSILHKEDLRLQDSSDFGADGLFCEWAYVVDLDAMTLEVYSGFNQSPGKDHGKFANIPRVDCNEKYTPVVLIKSYPLLDLPTVEVLRADCDRKEDE